MLKIYEISVRRLLIMMQIVKINLQDAVVLINVTLNCTPCQGHFELV